MSRWLKLLLTWMLALALPLQALAAAAMVHCGGHAGAGHHAPPGHVHGDAAGQPGHAVAGHGALSDAHPGAHSDAHPGAQAAPPAARSAAPAVDFHLAALQAPAADAVPAAAADPAADRSADPSADPSALSLHGKCSACAACCGVVALPSTAPALGSVAVDTAYTVASLPAHAGHVPAGDERPPRAL